MRITAPSRLDIREAAIPRTLGSCAPDRAGTARSVEVALEEAEIDGAAVQLLVALSPGLLGRGSALRLVGASPELGDAAHEWRSRPAGRARG
jgi:hypothetical protein